MPRLLTRPNLSLNVYLNIRTCRPVLNLSQSPGYPNPSTDVVPTFPPLLMVLRGTTPPSPRTCLKTSLPPSDPPNSLPKVSNPRRHTICPSAEASIIPATTESESEGLEYADIPENFFRNRLPSHSPHSDAGDAADAPRLPPSELRLEQPAPELRPPLCAPSFAPGGTERNIYPQLQYSGHKDPEGMEGEDRDQRSRAPSPGPRDLPKFLTVPELEELPLEELIQFAKVTFFP